MQRCVAACFGAGLMQRTCRMFINFRRVVGAAILPLSVATVAGAGADLRLAEEWEGG